MTKPLSQRVRMMHLLVGSSAEFSLESRIFHIICIISIVGAVLSIPINLIVGIPSLSVLMVVIGLIVLFLHYFSRFKYKTNTAITLFNIFINMSAKNKENMVFY
jgi:two-component system sensor histidine kinase/response regulator